MLVMDGIKEFEFNEHGLQKLKELPKGTNWPVVYLIHDEKNLYIGETTSAAARMSQHLKNEEKKNLQVIEIVFDGRFNKSVILDYEQRLIKYCSVDGKFQNILNKNRGQQAIHDYYQRKFYRKDIFEKALTLKEDEDKNLYLYLKWVFEDERQVESTFTMLAERPDISLKLAITKERFKKNLRNPESKLNDTASEQYEDILDKQADICIQIFSKPICVLSGAAGTGKTTVIKAIVENIERVHGQAAGFLLMAPTGKAAERIKTQTDKNSSTIHSFLASNGWLNKNFTLKRVGGGKGQDVNTIIIDECSMIDLNLFATLLRSINWNSVQRLILVGDPNQLPPIGRGKVFADTIEYRTVHRIHASALNNFVLPE